MIISINESRDIQAIKQPLTKLEVFTGRVTANRWVMHVDAPSYSAYIRALVYVGGREQIHIPGLGYASTLLTNDKADTTMAEVVNRILVE